MNRKDIDTLWHKALRMIASRYRKCVEGQRKPLTDEFLRKLHHLDEFGLFCDYDEFEQIARAVEQAHGINGDTE